MGSDQMDQVNLAKELRVTRRTISRDLEDLSKYWKECRTQDTELRDLWEDVESQEGGDYRPDGIQDYGFDEEQEMDLS
jgi:hypothetical protein